LPLLKEEGTDHQIELEEVNEKESKVPWGSLYNMTREKLLVLRKTLTELLNKQFIQVSNSSAAVSVLFIQKSEVNFSSVWTTVTWTESLEESLPSFIDIWDSAEHQTSSMIHQVECHSGISQDLNCCRRQMKDGISYEVQVVWMKWLLLS
jgi:hypothetical protein